VEVRPAEPDSPPPRRPLDGVCVVSLEQALAAPLASRHLADLGARVIKVERRESGDFARHYDTTVHGMSSAFVWLNRSKESLSLDLKSPAAAEVLGRLLGQADVLIQNLGPGAAKRLGLDAATLTGRYPRLIVCSISGYGSDGPYRDKKAYDMLVQAEVGLLSLTGTPTEKAKVGISIADIAAGMYAFSGTLAALLQRATTGEARPVEISLFDSLAEWMNYPLYFSMYGGVEPQRRGTRHATIAPYGAYTTADQREILVAVQNEREWHRFCAVFLGDPDLEHDDRFVTNSARIAHTDLLDEIVARRFGQFTRAEALDALSMAQIATAQISDMADLAAHPELTERNRWRDVASPAGMLQALVPPGIPAGTPLRMDPVPAVGEHTDSILKELGYTSARIAKLRSELVV
jgi:crotonobetainyl-CoA:carnitine CoA-transferase CaiB-like acyl-CoA transferase